MKKYLLLLATLLNVIMLAAQTPQLWGTMEIGGSFGIGTFIKINGDGTGFQKVFSLTDGSPWCTLTPAGGSLIYGTTVSGGTHSLGDIFSYNSSSGGYSILYSLDSASGFYPHGTVITATDGKLYGMTSNGGSHNLGVLFSLNPDNNSYTKLHEFDNTTGQYPDRTVMQASNGKLYGMTTTGGANGGGLIFSYDIVNNVFTDVHDFLFAKGYTPFGNLMEASNHLLYGMAFGGGTTGYGVIFSFDPSNNAYNVIHNFNGTDGSAPYADLVQGDNGLLYGCTSQGGDHSGGVIFSIDVTGTTFTKLHDFEDETGSKPWGGVMQASDGNLYGLTAFGGSNNVGTIYSYNLTSNTYTKLHDCDFNDGGFPYADLIEYYGTTGIENIGDATMDVYPNPSIGKFTVTIPNINRENATITISDVTGKILFAQSIKQTEMNMELNYPSGIYFLSLDLNDQLIQRKVIVE